MHVPPSSAAPGVEVTAAALRLQRSNVSGISGLFKNKKVFLIALFASLVFPSNNAYTEY
jgi:hypothetical protein